jgi:hypothetical protein
VITSTGMEYTDHRRFKGKLPHGQSKAEFLRLVQLETDECIIWPYAKGGQRGYGQVYYDRKKRYAHELALLHRVGPRPDGMYVLHGPCISPACMNYRHLRYGTPSENNLDRRRDGTAPIGEKNFNAKLTAEQVQEIRKRYANGEAQRALCAEYGVTVMTVNRAIRGESWSHIPLNHTTQPEHGQTAQRQSMPSPQRS